MAVRSASQMVKMFQDDSALKAKLQADPNPIQVLKDTAKKAEAAVDNRPIYTSDKPFYYIVVIVLGLVVLIAAIGSLVLAFDGGQTTPQVLVALGSAAVGALAGLFTPSPVGKQ
jgi:hypothetical protein